MAILTGPVERPLFARKRYALFLWMVQERSRVMRELDGKTRGSALVAHQ